MLPTTKLLRLPYLFIILSLSVSSAIAQVEDYRLWISRNAGGNGYGEIASINADGSAYDAGYVFPGNTDGTEANGLIMANDGQLYGTTRLGGKFNRGTLFRLSPDGSIRPSESWLRISGSAPLNSIWMNSDTAMLLWKRFSRYSTVRL